MTGADVPLIPRRDFFENPERTLVRISPDGSRIAFLAPLDGVLNVWVGETEAVVRDAAAARPITRDTGRGIRVYHWAYSGDHLLYLQDDGGDENWHLHRVDLATGEDTDLTPFPGVQARIEHLSPRHPERVLVGLNDRDPELHDVHAIDLRTGERELAAENPGFVGFVCDDDLRVRLGVRMTEDGGMDVLQAGGDGWTDFMRVEHEDALTSEARGFDATGTTLYASDSRGRDTAALVAVDAVTRVVTVLADDARADLDDVLADPRTRVPLAAAFAYERKVWQALDPAVADDLAFLAEVSAGDAQVVSQTLDGDLWVVAYVVDDGPRRFYLVERAARTARFLFSDRPVLEGRPLAPMRPVVVEARDGLPLVGYLTRPPGDAARGPVPMVLLVHGGPWGRDAWGFHPWHQWLANRGYAVLSVNFRGSTGFGKSFVNAGDRAWGAEMHDDLVDAVAWAVREGVADAARVAIMGGSYGGYATLAGLTFTPDTFACGIDLVGPSNLITLIESVPPYWKPMLQLFVQRIGDPRTPEGRDFLTSRSPLTFAGRIRRPLLIAQGANDPRVKQAESDQIVAAMRANEIPVTYAVYPDEGHGFARPENWLSFAAIAEAFLGEVLGGRVEPIGDDLMGSSVTVPEGAEGVPGLASVLAAAAGSDGVPGV